MSKLRKRSMSVFVPKHDNRLSKRFEGVASDNERHSDSEIDEDDDNLHTSIDEKSHELEPIDWTKADYDMLLEKLRSALPKKDIRKFDRTLQSINWEEIIIPNHSSEEVKKVTESLIDKVRRFRTLSEMLNDVPDIINKLLSAGKPKIPPHAYALYMKDNLARYRSSNMDMKNIFKIVSQEFQELSDKNKRKYEECAKRLKNEYKAKLLQYYEDHPEMKPLRKVKKKEPTKTPFNLFFHSRRETIEISLVQARKEWEALPIKKKLKYIRESFASENAGKLLNKKEQEMLDRDHGKPEFVGRNAFELFARKQRTQPDMLLLTGKERELKIRKDYKELTKQEKDELKVEYTTAREKYITQYRKYIEKLPVEKREAEIEHIRSLTEIKRKEKPEKKKEDKKANNSGKVLELYPGSGDFDQPVAESTTIKKAKTKKSSTKVTEIERQSPSKTVLSEKPKKNKTDSSSDETSKQLTKKELKPGSSQMKRASPQKMAELSSKKSKSSTEYKDSSEVESTVSVSIAVSKKGSSSNKPSDAAPVFVSATKNGSVIKDQKRRSSENTQSLVEIKKPKKSIKKEKPEESKPTKVPLPEPERPPGNPEEFYRQRIYKGKVGKHRESYANLSAAKKLEISEQMKAAQQQYIIDLENYLKSMPPTEIQRYIQKVKTLQTQTTNDNSDDSDEEDEDDSSSDSDEDSSD
ncbi:nucleolar transcription factor 1-like [Malaya genurostris]|uniref:nucleolar transcription factor 1-like n=1 Tax=Malaya genurostris TaxID=325434 RepID=UPI0026F3B57B|nr:nucleolar transcription factor 1-like [Malaya genurostris]